MVQRVTVFETDPEGAPKLAVGTALCRDALYERVPSRLYGGIRLSGRDAVTDWIRHAVLGDLETLHHGMKTRTTSHGGGNFLLLLGCMAALEYLATIFDAVEKGSAARMAKYARKFMANPRYATCMRLLVHARNGAAHGSWPGRIGVNNGQYRFAVGFETEYPDLRHLRLMPYMTAGEKEPQDTLFVNPRMLLVDLVASVENGFAEWIRNTADNEALKRAQPITMKCAESDLAPWRE